MRTLQGAYRRHVRAKMNRRTLSGRHSPRFAVVRHDSFVSDTKPHSRTFSEEARKDLGQAVQDARAGAGHPYRPSFAEFAGSPLGVRSLLKLEKGEPVSALVYEAAGRALGRLYEDWSVNTPLEILRGKPAPKGVLIGRSLVEPEAEQPSEDEDTASVMEEMPDPSRFGNLDDYLRAVIVHLRRRGMSETAIMRAVVRTVEEYEQDSADTERGGSDTASGRVSPSG